MSEKFDPVRRFNDRAPVYDNEVVKTIPGYAALHQTAGSILSSLLPERARVLVCGSGTGYEALSYARDNPGWSITGFDPAIEMIRVAQEKARSNALGERVSFIHGSVSDLPEDQFDGATSMLVKHFIPYEEKLSYVSNIAKRLKPGGVFLTVDITGHRDDEDFKRDLEVWEKFQRAHRDDVEEIEKTIDRVRLDMPILRGPETVSLLEENGFKNVRLFWKNLIFNGYIAERA